MASKRPRSEEAIDRESYKLMRQKDVIREKLRALDRERAALRRRQLEANPPGPDDVVVKLGS